MDASATAPSIEQSAVGVGASDVARRDLTADDERRMLEQQITERERAAAELAELNREDAARRCLVEAEVLRGYL